jgi:hypothetical protein
MSDPDHLEVHAALPAALSAPAAPPPEPALQHETTARNDEQPPSIRGLTLRRVTQANPDPDAEDLRPNAPDPFAVAGERLERGRREGLTVAHDTSPEFPPPPDAAVCAAQFVARIDVRLPWDDQRVNSVRMLLDRLRGVLQGELLTPPEATAAVHGAPRSREERPPREFRSPPGRPSYPRFGTVTSPDGANQSGFWSMSELAAQLGCGYTGVAHKYSRICREQGFDPNDHEGVEFTYRGYTVHLRVR